VIVTDGIHLMTTDSTTDAELHAFARRLGLDRRWYQHVTSHPHYDLTTGRMRQKALALGAHLVPSRELVRQCSRRR